MWVGGGNTKGEARREPGFLKKGKQIVESRNSGDYMEVEEIVKARRRGIFPPWQPVGTPLFPTGELKEKNS